MRGQHLLLGAALLVLALALHTHAIKKSRGPKWWSLAKVSDPSNLRSNHIVSNSLSDHYLDPAVHRILRKKQRKLVRENQGVLVAIAKGARMAVHECKHQFRNRRWNCMTSPYNRSKSLFGKIVSIPCRETSFLYAVMAGAIIHAVTRACTEGTIESCTCDYRSQGPSGQTLPPQLQHIYRSQNHAKHPQQMGSHPQPGMDWEWGGCSEDIDYGHKFSRLFVDAGENNRNEHHMVNKHNNEAGRQHVIREMRQECKCHGMSGSCTVKTCWRRLPYFRKVSNIIKARFDGASRVKALSQSNNNRQTNDKRRNRRRRKKSPRRRGRGGGGGELRPYNPLKPYDPEHKPPTSMDLVYVDTSPDFCSKDKKLGLRGTAGRECNATSDSVEGCDLMCCGRGYHTRIMEVQERCSCTFKWCCEVSCQICKRMKTTHTCS